MIRICQINRKIDTTRAGQASDGNCKVLLITGTGEVEKASFRLTPEEEKALSLFTQGVERRIGNIVTAEWEGDDGESTPEHATDPEAYCPACREYSCLLLRKPRQPSVETIPLSEQEEQS